MKDFLNPEFRQRSLLTKKEINDRLNIFDKRLRLALLVKKASIRPDGGITEVGDRHGVWRIILVGESEYHGNDIENVLAGIVQGKKKGQYFTAAGNAIERILKNFLEIRK